MVVCVIQRRKGKNLSNSKPKYIKNKKTIKFKHTLITFFLDSYKLINLITPTASNLFANTKHGRKKTFQSNLHSKFKACW